MVGAIVIGVRPVCLTFPLAFELATGTWLPATGLVMVHEIDVLVTTDEHFLPAHSSL